MGFFTSSITILQKLVVAIGAGLGVFTFHQPVRITSIRWISTWTIPMMTIRSA